MAFAIEIVDLGFISGGEASVAGICNNLHALLNVDAQGTPLNNLPMMDTIKNANDFDAVVVFTAGGPSKWWLNQAWASYGTLVAAGVNAGMATDMASYYNAGQLFGVLESLKGGAQYEVLIRRPGEASKGIDAQSIAHIYFVLLIVIGNYNYLKARRK